MKVSRLIILFLVVVLLVSFVSTTFADSSYVVQPGDTLIKIARQYEIEYLDLAAANNLEEPYVIRVGQVLVIPEGNQFESPMDIAPLPQAAAFQETLIPLQAPATDTSSVDRLVRLGAYRVQPGDSISRIAQQYGTDYLTLAAVNSIEEPYIIWPDEIINFPCIFYSDGVQDPESILLSDSINPLLPDGFDIPLHFDFFNGCDVIPGEPTDGENTYGLPGQGNGSGGIDFQGAAGPGLGSIRSVYNPATCSRDEPFIRITAEGGAALTAVRIYYLDRLLYTEEDVRTGSAVSYCGPFTHYAVEAPQIARWSVFSTRPFIQ